jgi:hypothetical protein
MSQSLPLARIRLVKVEVRGHPDAVPVLPGRGHSSPGPHDHGDLGRLPGGAIPPSLATLVNVPHPVDFRIAVPTG